MEKYVVLEKAVGQTPLMCAEEWRQTQSASYQDVPLAYAGRLDPMASGKLLVLIGDECKNQEGYHQLDKEYQFEILFGIKSDSADVLGIVEASKQIPVLEKKAIDSAARSLTGPIELPYPHYSAKTVKGKPLHTWAIEGRLDEITIPTKESTIYNLSCVGLRTISTKELKEAIHNKIESFPTVTDPRKAIGNDFRRPEVRLAWQKAYDTYPDREYQIATFNCVSSSGTYMRTLAEIISTKLGTTGLAFSIHRSIIGSYTPLPFNQGWWRRRLR